MNTVRAICIDDSKKPKEIPAKKWVVKGKPYTINHIFVMKNQNGIKGCELDEHDISDFDLDSFEKTILDRLKTIKEKGMLFESIDEVFCRPLDYFLHDAKIEGLKEIKLVKAIKDTDNKSYVWCTHEGEVTERQMCKKAECPYYSSKSGRGVCEHRGQLYLHDEEVTINVALGKEKEEKAKQVHT